jgi:hypothetical protein
MQPSFEMFLVIANLSAAFAVAGLVVDDFIIRHVCRREGRAYPVLWFWRWYWVKRVSSWSWYREASDAGYFKLRVTLHIATACLFVGAVFLLEFAPSRVPLVH